MIGHVTLSTSVPINYEIPAGVSGADFAALAEQRLTAYGSAHPTGANFAMGDGSVQFLGDELSFEVLQSLGTRSASDPTPVAP